MNYNYKLQQSITPFYIYIYIYISQYYMHRYIINLYIKHITIRDTYTRTHIHDKKLSGCLYIMSYGVLGQGLQKLICNKNLFFMVTNYVNVKLKNRI